MLDTLELLRFLLDEEILAVADDLLDNFDHFVGVGCREEAVLGRDIDLGEGLLELHEALVVRLLFVELVGFVVDHHLEVAQIKL